MKELPYEHADAKHCVLWTRAGTRCQLFNSEIEQPYGVEGSGDLVSSFQCKVSTNLGRI